MKEWKVGEFPAHSGFVYYSKLPSAYGFRLVVQDKKQFDPAWSNSNSRLMWKLDLTSLPKGTDAQATNLPFVKNGPEAAVATASLKSRGMENEDRGVVLSQEKDGRLHWRMGIVADGVSNQYGAGLAVPTFCKYFVESLPNVATEGDLLALAHRAAKLTNRAINLWNHQFQKEWALTTFSMIFLYGARDKRGKVKMKALKFSLGDSPIYRIRPRWSRGKKVERLNVDDTMRHDLERALLAKGINRKLTE
jgi:hypothetical protein